MAKHKSKAKRQKQRKQQRKRPGDPLAKYTFKTVPHRRRVPATKQAKQAAKKKKKTKKNPKGKVRSKFEPIADPLDQRVPPCPCLIDDKCACIEEYLATILSHHARAYSLFTSRFPHKDRLTLASLANALTTTLWPTSVPITLSDIKLDKKSLGISGKRGAQAEMLVGTTKEGGIRCRGHGKSQYAAKCMALVHGMLAVVELVASGRAEAAGVPSEVRAKVEGLKLGKWESETGKYGSGKPQKLGPHPTYTDAHLNDNHDQAIHCLKIYAPTLLATRAKSYVTLLPLLHHLGLDQPFESTITYMKPKWTRVTLTLPPPDPTRSIGPDNKPVTVHGDGRSVLESRARALRYLAAMVVEGRVGRETRWSGLSEEDQGTEGWVFAYDVSEDYDEDEPEEEEKVEEDDGEADMDLETDEERVALGFEPSTVARAAADDEADSKSDSDDNRFDSSGDSDSDDDSESESEQGDGGPARLHKGAKRQLDDGHPSSADDDESDGPQPPLKRLRLNLGGSAQTTERATDRFDEPPTLEEFVAQQQERQQRARHHHGRPDPGRGKPGGKQGR